jgi:leader peptidase (prepilin peptidase) / N-methyltransferase
MFVTPLITSLLFLVLGSFLSVLIQRLPLLYYKPRQFFAHGKWGGIVSGRSECPSCHKTLKWWHLIPLFSFLYQRGKCSYCHKPIPRYHLIIEIGCLFSYGLALLVTPRYEHQVLLGLLGSFSLALLLIDTRWFIIPHFFLYALSCIGIIHLLLLPEITTHVLTALTTMIVGMALLGSIRYAYLKLRNMEALGLGDVYLMIPIGLWIPLEGLPYVIFIASIITLLWAYMLSHLNKRSYQFKSRLPFGPGLLIATYIIVILQHMEILFTF